MKKKQVCMICGVEYKTGKGFIEPHKRPCYNARHNSALIIEK